MSLFYFALTNPEVESLFKIEVMTRFPSLRLSYVRPGFFTFKSDVPVVFNPFLARVAGVSKGKYKFDELDFSRAWVWKFSENLVIPESLKSISDQTIFKIGETVTLIMMLGPDEYWVGEYVQRSSHFQTPGEVSSIAPREVPSRAYFKIAEAFEAFDLPFDSQEIVLELGSAPGGATLFLLEQDLRVIGVDPAEMDPLFDKKKGFKHWKKSFETLEEKDFKEDIDWIISDVNLPPTVVLGQIQRMLKFLNPRGLILTLKLNEAKHLIYLLRVVDDFRKLGFKKVELKYLPTHRKEILLMALNS